MKTGKVKLISVLKACQSYVGNPSQLTRMVSAPTTLVGPLELKLQATLQPPPPPLPQLQFVHRPASTPSTSKAPRSFGNPCHDLYFHVVRDTVASRKYLNQLLPLAWFHNPLTTLKLICNLLDSAGKDEVELFYTAAFWLYQNHPKTLARNVVPIAGSVGDITNMLEILYGILDVKAETKRKTRVKGVFFEYEHLIQDKVGTVRRYGEKKKDGGRISSNKRKEIINMAKKAVEMYERDPDYQLLHERVSDLYAECLKSDIRNLKKYEKQKMDNVSDPEKANLLELTSTAKWCPSVDSFFDYATLLSETIARKLFPREECKKGVSVEEEEADYVSRVRERLMKEVLEPLRKVIEDNGLKDDSRRYWWDNSPEKYLKDVKAGESKIEADAMLPHEIILYAHDRNFGELAEPQWKAMVEEIYSKQGKFKNCLAVCDVSGRMCGHPMNVSLGMGQLVAELSEEPWKGKVFTFSRNPQLLSIQGDDLKSKCAFMRRMDNQDWDGDNDLKKVFDLILEVAVNKKLKPEQIIKRVYVFTSEQDFDDASGHSWKTDYQEIQRKFKEKGYGDVVPRIVFWDLTEDVYITPVARSEQQGVATMTGYSRKFVQCFVENDGDIGPDHVMEAAICGELYQGLAVVD